MILLNPGPVTLSPAVRRALQREDLCHREPEFAELTQSICQKIEAIYTDAATNHAAVLLTTSGSGAVEAMLSTFAPKDSTTLVVCNGVYGERMLAMLQRQGKPCRALVHPWESAIDLQQVARVLQLERGISHLAVVQHETTTGRLNDLAPLAALCREFQIGLLVDAVSSFGAELIDFVSWQPVAIAATANKCLHGIPGISLVLAQREALEREASQATTLYLDLIPYYRDQRQGWSPFTQAVQGFFALDVALDELETRGSWQARRELYRERSARVSARLAANGVLPLLEEGASSSMLRAYHLPRVKDYAHLHDGLKARGFTIYAGQGALLAQVFRIATMGEITEQDMQHLLSSLDEVFAE